jgi:DNA-binding CsgD family transcriptional regulator/tetratricopeptide (TPR) repeat protein
VRWIAHPYQYGISGSVGEWSLMPNEQRCSLLSERGVTRREADVLVALAERLSNARIAERLYLSERTVESHVSSLLRKLGAGNRVELGDLAKEILAGPDVAPPSPLPAPLALLTDPASFVGREPEMDHLRRLWCRAEAGHLLVGVVAGEAGVGKSRLLAEFAAEVHCGGARVLLGACFEDLGVPYEPFVQMISADVATLSKQEVRRRAAGAADRLAWLVPELGGAGSGGEQDSVLDPASVQAEVFASLHRYLDRAADHGPLLLVVEDVHWATSTTLGALRHLGRVSGDAPVLILVTTRVGPADVDANLAQFLGDVRQLPAVETIDLDGLSEAEVAALIAALGGRSDPAAVRAKTGGNPLLVREIAGGPPRGRTGSLHALLARRYSLLDQQDLSVLDLASVVGLEFDADLLSAAAGRPLPEVIDSLERAEVAGLVVRHPAGPGRFSFVHALFRDAKYDEIAVRRRMELHRQVAQALGEQTGDRVLSDLARHASIAAPLIAAPLVEPAASIERAGEAAELASRARRSLRQAGDRAMALNDFAAARRAYHGALQLWPRGDLERPGLLLELGRAVFTAERRGADVLREARDGLLALGDHDGAAEAEMMLGELAWIASRWDAAEVHFDRAAELVADRPPSRQTAHVTAGLARMRMVAGANREARRHGTRALEMAQSLALPALQANVLHTIGPARVADGDLGGIRELEAGVELAEALGSPEVLRGYANLAYVHNLLGDADRSRHWRQRAGAAAERFGLADGMRWARAHDIGDRFQLGRWDEAIDAANAFIAETESSAHYLVTVYLRVRAAVRMGRGNQIGALADAAAALEYDRGAKHPSALLVALPFFARCLFETGRSADADAAVTESLNAAAGNENILEPIETAIAMFGLGRETEYLDTAARITLPSKRWEVGRAIALGDLQQAARMLERSEQRSAEAYVRLMAAEHLAAHGRRREAEAQAQRALAFHRSVAATTYISRGEQLIGAITTAANTKGVHPHHGC